MKKQNLTPEQYERTNKVMLIILTMCYLLYVVVEISNIYKNGINSFAIARCILYLSMTVAITIVVKLLGKKKAAMIVLAVTFLITYTFLLFGNGVGCMALVFPALIGFMIYLNSKLVMIGCVSTLIICTIKNWLVMGNEEAFGYANVAVMGLLIAVFGSYHAINLLIDFSKEDQEAIRQIARHRKEVALVVAESVENLDEDFHQLLDGVVAVNHAMDSAHIAMNEIAGSTESTADAVNRQVDMTEQIQQRLENANTNTAQAREITEQLKTTILEGKKQADDLEEQSNLVDKNTDIISGTVEVLVQKVQKVSGITEAILKISSQTNLLALNASVEAARAGEAGKGFAVVAEQIRTLAEETKVSTEQITTIIEELTKITKETRSGIQESENSIRLQRQKVEAVNESFAKVEAGMQKLRSGVESISQETQEVLDANGMIVESISMLSEASQQVMAGTQTGKEAMDKAFDGLQLFIETVEGTFEKMQKLKVAAGVENEVFN